jgi:hypothetical protein
MSFIEKWIHKQTRGWKKMDRTQKAIIASAILMAGFVWALSLAYRGLRWLLKL